MKTKQLFFIFAFCLLGNTLFAQVGKFNVGVDVYTNYSVYSGEERYNAKVAAKPAITFGVVASYQFNNKVSVESGLKYVNRGHEENGYNGYNGYDHYLIDITFPHSYYSSDSKTVQNYNYLSVPLNVRLSLNNHFDKGFYLRFGVSADFFLSGEAKRTYTDFSGENRLGTYANNEDIRKTHLNLNYGIGYAFLFPKNFQLSVEPAFEYMFYKMYHKGGEFSYNSAGIKLRFMFL